MVLMHDVCRPWCRPLFASSPPLFLSLCALLEVAGDGGAIFVAYNPFIAWRDRLSAPPMSLLPLTL